MAKIVTKYISDSAVTAAKIAADAVTGAKIRLDNDQYLRGRNAGDSADINIFKVNASDNIEAGAALDMGSNNIITSGNVDGRDVSADGTALDAHLNGGASKHDATEIDYERTDGSKKNIQAASDDAESAITDLDDAIGDISALGTPTNYSTADETEVAARLAGIDSALASAGGTDFADNTFRISDNTTASKKIAFEASGITAANVRTITMADADVDLGDIATLNAASHAALTLNSGDATQQSANLSGQELELVQATTTTDGVMSAEDKTKLDGVEALADVTDATNVAAAGATMDSDSSLAGNSYFLDEDNMASDDATKVPSQQSVKAYADTKLALAGGTMSGAIAMGTSKITGLGDPTAAQDAATKAYVDSVAEGLKPKQAVRAATTANIDLDNDLEDADTLDGVTLATGDRVLVKDQTAAEENGIYVVVASGTASRAADFDSLSPIDEINGAYVPVQEGTANAGKFFVQTGTVATLDTDAVDFVFFNSAASLSGGDGIDITANAISVDHDGEGLTFATAQLALELDGATLSKSASGVKVADGGITATQLGADSVTAAKLNADTAGAALVQNGGTGALDVNVDDSSIEIATDALQVKALGITNAMLAGSIADSKLNQITTANKVAGSAVQLNASGAIENSTGLQINVDATNGSTAINGSNEITAVRPAAEVITLDGTDISNGYIDLASDAFSAASIHVTPAGGIEQVQGTDYTVSLTGGAGGVTRITFAGDLSAQAADTDVILVSYSVI